MQKDRSGVLKNTSQPGKGLSRVQRLGCVTMYINNHDTRQKGTSDWQGRGRKENGSQRRSVLQGLGEVSRNCFTEVEPFGATRRGQGTDRGRLCLLSILRRGLHAEALPCVCRDDNDDTQCFLMKSVLTFSPECVPGETHFWVEGLSINLSGFDSELCHQKAV